LVELDPVLYKLVDDFDQRFPEGAPSLRKASSLKVEGDFTFGHGVQVLGDVELESESANPIPADTVLDG
jgi:UTP--glucose-1-phosphate uridylyltransferase